MRTPPATTRFFNGLGRRVAYFYVRRLMRSDIEWRTDLPSGAKIIAVNHPTTTDSFLVMSWPCEPIYILISEAAFRVPLVFEHDADDREAVKLSTDVLMEEIKRLMERGAKRLLDASWPSTTRMREFIGETDAPQSPAAHIMTGSVAVIPEKGSSVRTYGRRPQC